MPRISAAERQANLFNRQRTGRHVEVSAPQCLTTSWQRETFQRLLDQHPHLAVGTDFNALSNYILVLGKLRRLRASAGDDAEFSELAVAVRRFEQHLRLPPS